MAIITSHSGGPYYEWRRSVMGSPPPTTFDENADIEGVLYHDWQHGVPRPAARIDYDNARARAAGHPAGGGGAISAPPTGGAGAGSGPPIGPPPPSSVIAVGGAQGGAGGPTAVAASPAGGTGSPPTSKPQPVTGPNPFGLDNEQETNIGIVIQVGFNEHAPDLALLAMVLLGGGENGFSRYGCNASQHCGFFQLSTSWQSQHDYHDIAYWAGYAYLQGFYGRGGLIHLANEYPNESAGYLTNLCQGAYNDPNAGATYYNDHTPNGPQILAYYGAKLRSGWKPTYTSSPTVPSGPHPIGAGDLAYLIPRMNWAGNMDNLADTVFKRGDSARKISRATRTHVTHVNLIDFKKG